MAPKTKTDDLVDDPSTELAAIRQRYLDLVEEVNTTSAEDITKQIAQRILDADSVDDILGLADSEATGAKALVGRPFVLLERPTWAKGGAQYTEGAGVFVIMQCGMQDTNEVIPVTCGGDNVLAQLYSMQSKGMLPNDKVMTFVTKKTAAGFDVLWLAAFDQRK